MSGVVALVHHRLPGTGSALVDAAVALDRGAAIEAGPGTPPGTLAALGDRIRAICVLRDPVDRVCALYEQAGGGTPGGEVADRECTDGDAAAADTDAGPLSTTITERRWSLADVYRELGGAGPRRSELHALFADFFNGQARALLDPWNGEGAKLGHWAGMTERGAARRNQALTLLDDRYVVGTHERLGPSLERWAETFGWDARAMPQVSRRPRPLAFEPDVETRALILAHNEIDAELHARHAGALARQARRPRRGQAVCVLGMSRSGTSLTMRILNVLGVHLGQPEEMMRPAPGNNPTGFWEHDRIVRLDEDILGELTGQTPSPRPMWSRPPPLPAGWQHSPQLRAHRDAARAILRETFAGIPIWGWKDPRACLTLPFWQMLMPPMRYVICVRHPLDVAASLQTRDGIALDRSLQLWLLYTSHAVLNTRGQERTFVAHDGYFPSWERQAERLSDFVGNGSISGGQRAAIADHLDDRLWHHRDGAGRDDELPAEARTLYRLLATLSEFGPDAATEAALDEAAARSAAVAQA